MRRKALPSTILLLGLAFAAGADDRARLLSITAAGDADSSVVAVEGDRPLSFTTLQLQAPPRVVVDFADTSVAGVPAELSVEDGTVRRVATADAGSGTARVVIELAADAEFDVRAKGNRLEVRVPRIAPFVAQAAPPKPETTPPKPEATPANPAAAPPNPVAGPPKPEAVASNAEPAPAGQPAAAAPLEASLEHAPAAQAPASAEAEKRASLPTVSLVGSRPAAPPPEPKPVSAAEEKKRRAAEKLAVQKRAVAEAAEAKRRAKEERLAAAVAAKKAAAGRAAEAKRAAAEARRVAAEKRLALLAEKKAKAGQEAEEKKKLALARPAPVPRAPAVEETRTLTVQEAMALRAAAEQGLPTGLGPAAAPVPPKPPAEKPEPRRTARAEPAPRGDRIAINSIGFRPVGNGEVIIRSDKPLTYGVGGDEHAVLLHLPGSAIPRPNDRRPLDTHFFDGPVLRVVPIDVPGGIDLRIELRAKAEYQLSQSGAVLTVVFAAPK